MSDLRDTHVRLLGLEAIGRQASQDSGAESALATLHPMEALSHLITCATLPHLDRNQECDFSKPADLAALLRSIGAMEGSFVSKPACIPIAEMTLNLLSSFVADRNTVSAELASAMLRFTLALSDASVHSEQVAVQVGTVLIYAGEGLQSIATRLMEGQVSAEDPLALTSTYTAALKLLAD